MHGIENQDSHAKMGVNGQWVQPMCLPACVFALVGVLSMVYAFMVLLLYRGFVEAYRDLLEIVSGACNVTLGSQVWRHIWLWVNSRITKAPAIGMQYCGGQFLGTCDIAVLSVNVG